MADLATARKEAEECLRRWYEPRHDFAAPGYAHLRHSDAVDCVLALKALLAAYPEPAPALPEEVREAEEKVRGHFKPNGLAYTPFGEDVLALLAALAAPGGRS